MWKLSLTVFVLAISTACTVSNPLAGSPSAAPSAGGQIVVPPPTSGGTTAPVPAPGVPAPVAPQGDLSAAGLVRHANALPIPSGYGAKLDQAARLNRLTQVDLAFRSGSHAGALAAAGYAGTINSVDARQPEEETHGNTGYYSGSQVTAQGPVVYPMCLTTDDPGRVREVPGNTRKHLANANTGSTLYTNVFVQGAVTMYADCTNWGQVWPSASTTVAAASVQGATGGVSAPAAAPADNCLTYAQLSAKARSIDQPLNHPAGTLAGIQMVLKEDWEAPPGWTFHLNGASVPSAKAGQKISAWSPDSCRPLA